MSWPIASASASRWRRSRFSRSDWLVVGCVRAYRAAHRSVAPCSPTEPAPSAAFAGALALRLLHLQQVVANDPFYSQPSVDSLVYRDWALRIAGGDWLGSEPFFLSPLYGYLLAVVYWIAGPSHFWPLVLNALFGAGACALVFLLAARLFDRRAAVVAAVLAATYPHGDLLRGRGAGRAARRPS